MRKRQRLDTDMLRRGLVSSRAEAQTMITCGRVRVGRSVAIKSSTLVSPSESVHIVGEPPRYVSRGGVKLEHAIKAFGICVEGSRVIDVGSSTGGFTDCLLQHGAKEVVAVDVGRNQLHERLRADPRVKLYERTDVRDIDIAAIGGSAPLVTADLSFISLRKVMCDLRRLATTGVVLLVKPQFEAGKLEADRAKGVIRDPKIHKQAVANVVEAVAASGMRFVQITTSPVKGAAGNTEFFIHAHVSGSSVNANHASASQAISDASQANALTFGDFTAF